MNQYLLPGIFWQNHLQLELMAWLGSGCAMSDYGNRRSRKWVRIHRDLYPTLPLLLPLISNHPILICCEWLRICQLHGTDQIFAEKLKHWNQEWLTWEPSVTATTFKTLCKNCLYARWPDATVPQLELLQQYGCRCWGAWGFPESEMPKPPHYPLWRSNLHLPWWAALCGVLLGLQKSNNNIKQNKNNITPFKE